MKTYYLRLTKDDFTLGPGTCTSNIVDLYDNGSYRNYSTVKSNYGTNLLENRVWTGLGELEPKTWRDVEGQTWDDIDLGPWSSQRTTSKGQTVSNRFIDYTGRIDLNSYEVEILDTPGPLSPDPLLDVYTLDTLSIDDLDLWANKKGITQSRGIYIINSYRYAVFVLNFNPELDLDNTDFVLWVRIEIDPPVMAPMYDSTRTVLNKFPEWMAVREYDYPNSSTPMSIGGSLLNAVAGEWLEELAGQIDYLRLQQFIDTADPSQVAWIYYSTDVPELIEKATGDGIDLSHANDLHDFYNLLDTEDGMFWDEGRRVLYTNKLYDSLTINGIEYPQAPQPIWNWFDEFGVMVDLYRHHLEDNETFRGRILDVYRNRPGVGLEAFKFALRRELNLWKDWGATPNSDYPGATPSVLELEDIENEISGPVPYVGLDGVPTAAFIAIVDELAELYPTTWGYFRWDRQFWDAGGENNDGYSVLPYRYDAEFLDDEFVQSGVGDGDDLLVLRPDVERGTRDFQASVKLKGRNITYRTEFPEVELGIEIYGTADRKLYDNPVTTSWLTVVAVTPGPDYYTSFQLASKSDVDVTHATASPSTYAVNNIIDTSGKTRLGLTWYHENGTQQAANFQLAASGITELRLYFGRFNPLTLALTDFPVGAIARAWWTNDPATKINTTPTNTYIAGDITKQPSVVMESLQTNYTIARWQTEHYPYTVKLNGKQPGNTLQNATVNIPSFVWDQNLEATPNKAYVIQMTSVNSENEYGGYTNTSDGNKLFLHSSYFDVNGLSSWSSDGKQTITFGTSVLTFKTLVAGEATTSLRINYNETASNYNILDLPYNSASVYPLLYPVWNIFESTQNVVINGIVDENGPWREGRPATPGNNNYSFAYLELDRNDFGIPNTEDYIITWIGIESNDNNVITWLDNNTVKPAVRDSATENLVYTSDVVKEIHESGVYSFSPIIARARLRTEIAPQWYPQIHSGYFYDHNQEYYFYVDPKEEQATANIKLLSSVARQGAPIIVATDEATPRELIQVNFWDEEHDFMILTHTERVLGTGANELYLAYDNIYDAVVTDTETARVVPADTSTSTNRLVTADPMVKNRIYEVQYRIDKSFVADNAYRYHDGTQRTQLEFDKSPADEGVSAFNIVYENSIFETATPVNLPLNTFYTIIDEGFLFISHDEYYLQGVEVRFSPSRILADGKDYLVVTLRAFDANGNPKPNLAFSLTTSFGTLEASELETNIDGFASTILTSENTTTTLDGTLTISGAINATATFEIVPVNDPTNKVVAIPSPDQVSADGKSQVVVYGAVENANHSPVPYAYVYYRKGRSVYEVFNQSRSTTDVSSTPSNWPSKGRIIADSRGRFTLGPFTAATPNDPGYWFLAAESDGASPSGSFDMSGDMVYWYEHPYNDKLEVNRLPKRSVQAKDLATPISYTNQKAFPVKYDESAANDTPQPVTINWEPPKWYGIDRYTQYQMKLLGDDYYDVDVASLDSAHPDYKDV